MVPDDRCTHILADRSRFRVLSLPEELGDAGEMVRRRRFRDHVCDRDRGGWRGRRELAVALSAVYRRISCRVRRVRVLDHVAAWSGDAVRTHRDAHARTAPAHLARAHARRRDDGRLRRQRFAALRALLGSDADPGVSLADRHASSHARSVALSHL